MDERKRTRAGTGPKEIVAVKLDAALLAKVDAEQARLMREAPHFEPTRSDAVRALIARGAGVVVAGGPAGRGTLRVRRGVVLPEGESIEGGGLGGGGPIAVKGSV